ncbi:hypothetical protein [Vibrio sp. 10N.261.55.A7]|uniref:hypothetical protein n=1 Tax=Vibrio sp. 10N.261.55.A7 TaxID=1880851 RepID=UPI000C81F6B1|nr:hypothetical protein [Vibrio sp. 10N.261.55.A7]PMJ91535.1 hypothetical protein BCU12_09585 [Vibrio sp. 10N.261.55.A7]
MMSNLYFVSIAIIFSFSSNFAVASERESDSAPITVNCRYDKGYIDKLKTPLKDLQSLAVEVGQQICVSSLKVLPNESIPISKQLNSFAAQAKKELDGLFPTIQFDGMSSISEDWYQMVTSENNDYRNFSLIEATPITSGVPPRAKEIEFKLYSDSQSLVTIEMGEEQKKHCNSENSTKNTTSAGACLSTFDQWRYAVSPFQALYTDRILKDNGKKISKLQSQWKHFVEESRYQTELDVWATTVWYGDQFQQLQLSGPPSSQLFLLHPMLVFEHLPDAEKGERDDVSIAVEWFGVNWWKKGFGVSVTSVYNDRKDQPAVGTGATIHIKNKYSVGYVYRNNGDDSIFFNLDLMEWLGDKENKYKKYKAYFN